MTKGKKGNMNILKLRGKMVENGYGVESLAEVLDIDRTTLYRKLNDGEKFTIGEAQKINSVLKLTPDEAHEIFFS
jgi:plasmid maintenance system antidote protein VapI